MSANFTAPYAGGGDPAFLVTVLGGLGWLMGLVAAVVALRRSGAPLAAAALMGVAAVFVVHDAATAPFAMLCLLAGAAYIEFLSPGLRRLSASRPPGTPTWATRRHSTGMDAAYGVGGVAGTVSVAAAPSGCG